ncbi:MAG: exosortase A [Pseudomonadota bacterium]
MSYSRLSMVGGPDKNWRAYAYATVAALLGLIWVYRETAWSLVVLWQSSETYAHGYIIYPVSLFLIWREREYLRSLKPQPNAPAIAALVVLACGWTVAQSAGVQVIAQYMFVAMIPILVTAILGWRVARAIAFPLAFTLLAVPFGEVFIRPLIDFTADFTVTALQFTGIPVFREGNQFSVPSGNWSVVEACSGLRYLIASFTLGCLYAYLTYRSRLRQLIFVVLAIIVPIIANGFRAYMIVMIAHYSNMELAVGVDHLIYGWLFFGLVMLILFWIGTHWREDNAAATHGSKAQPGTAQASASPAKAISYAAAALALAAAAPIYLHYLERQTFNPAPIALTLPQSIGAWTAVAPAAGVQPVFPGAAATALQEYRNGDRVIGIHVALFRNQHQGAEAITSQNVLADEKNHGWDVTSSGMHTLSGMAAPAAIRQSILRRDNQHLLAWQWYWIGDQQTANQYLAKWLQARQRLSGSGDDCVDIALFALYDIQPDEVTGVMQDFMRQAMPLLRQNLQQISRTL